MKKFFTLIMVVALAMANGSAFAQTVVLDENFDAFSNGSVEVPGTVDITGYSSTIEHRLASILSGWSGRYVYEAGGALLIKDGGNIQTGYLNTSTDGASARATFRVKCMDSYGGIVKFSLGYSTTAQEYIYDGEWHTLSVYFTGNSYSKVKIEPYMSASGIVIDDLKIETSPAFVASPELYHPTDATKTGFTAMWKKVTGATGYQVNVFSYNGNAREYLLQNEETTNNYLMVTGMDADKQYFFTVKTVKGEYVSEESAEMEVIPVYTSIDAPVATAATNVTANGFTANWQAVENAESYNVTLSKIEILSEARDAAVLNEDFAGVTKGTVSSPELGTMSESSQDAYTANPGWTAANACYSVGCMGIAPYGDTGYINTPVLNLSGNAGAFSVDLSAVSSFYGTFKDDEIKVAIYHAGESEPVEVQTVSLSASGFTSHHLEFTSGNAQTIVRVEYTGSNKVLVDEIAVNQSLAAGSKISSVISTENTPELSMDYAVELVDNVSYMYTVTAQVRSIANDEVVVITSAASNEITVNRTTTAISNVDVEAPKTVKSFRNGQIVIRRGNKTYSTSGIEM